MRRKRLNAKMDERLAACVLAGAALILSARFLIWPAFSRGRELEKQIAEDSAACAGQRELIELRPGLERETARRRLALSIASKPYYAPLKTWEMDALITGLAVKHGLVPAALSLTEAAPEMPDRYPYQRTEVPPERDSETEDTPEVYVLTAKAQLEADGTAEQWQAFLDDAARHAPGLRVTCFEVLDRDGEDGASADTVRFVCGLEIYMCPKEP